MLAFFHAEIRRQKESRAFEEAARAAEVQMNLLMVLGAACAALPVSSETTFNFTG